MELQQGISLKRNLSLVGKTIPVLVEQVGVQNFEPLHWGRSEWDAPEIDGKIHIKGPNLTIGQFHPIKITKALPYDLEGALQLR